MIIKETITFLEPEELFQIHYLDYSDGFDFATMLDGGITTEDLQSARKSAKLAFSARYKIPEAEIDIIT